MSANLLSMLNELFDESAPPSQESLSRLLEETFGFVRDLKAKFDSKDPKKREEAIVDAQELQVVLSSKLGALAEKTGLDPAQIATLMQDANTLSPEDRNLIEEVKEKFEQIQRSGHHPKVFKPLVR